MRRHTIYFAVLLTLITAASCAKDKQPSGMEGQYELYDVLWDGFFEDEDGDGEDDFAYEWINDLSQELEQTLGLFGTGYVKATVERLISDSSVLVFNINLPYPEYYIMDDSRILFSEIKYIKTSLRVEQIEHPYVLYQECRYPQSAGLFLSSIEKIAVREVRSDGTFSISLNCSLPTPAGNREAQGRLIYEYRKADK